MSIIYKIIKFFERIEQKRIEREMEWSKWIDVDVYHWTHKAYLLQVKVNRRTHEKIFKTVRIGPRYALVNLVSVDLEKLNKCIEDNEQKEAKNRKLFLEKRSAANDRLSKLMTE